MMPVGSWRPLRHSWHKRPSGCSHQRSKGARYSRPSLQPAGLSEGDLGLPDSEARVLGLDEMSAVGAGDLPSARAFIVNATGPQPAVAIEDLTWQAHLDQLLFFVKSPTLLLQAVLPGMKRRRRGRVIQIGSDIFERAVPGMSAYVAAKGAQLGLTRSWARELGPFGITVNFIAPGWIPVERHAGASPENRRDYLADVPLGRMGVPEDIAAAVSHLASSAAGFITGERLTINGGHTID
ncbi:MAG TPA: 3-oxoacyl-ACP reductase [Actinobacteria bacterium]|nr:3-oxoacyl-ACP reductase [Actinomycetota bacterium]